MAIRNIIFKIFRHHSCLSHYFSIVLTAVKPQSPHLALCHVNNTLNLTAITIYVLLLFLVLQELAKISHDDEEEEADDEDLDQHSRHFLKYAKQIREMKVCKNLTQV